jgi:ribosome biogenesis GTPase
MLDIINYGYDPTLEPIPEGIEVARVAAVYKERYELICRYGLIYGRLKSSVYYDKNEEFPTTGDFVWIQYNPSVDSVIIKTLERKSFFSRLDPIPGKGMQAVAANFDYVFILTSLNRDFNLKRLERYLALSWQSGGIPVILLTKSDLIEDPSEYVKQVEKTAKNVLVHTISVKTGYGLQDLSEYLKPRKTVVLLGSSGVGKSSLINALAGSEIMKVNEIREDDARGRHTTTKRQLIPLSCGAMIIDTPGMRSVGMQDTEQGLGEAFSDVEEYFGKCRFKDCKHSKEPGCAIKAALQNGELSLERWNSYLQLKRESEYSEDPFEYLKKKKEKFKTIAKINKEKYKGRIE